MEIVKKPDIRVFASEAKSGEIISFPDVLRGWGITLDQTQGKPPLEWMNGAFNRIDLNNLYLLQQGIPEWHKSIRYPINSIVKKADKIYLCVAENENNEPSNNSDKWALYVRSASEKDSGVIKIATQAEVDAGTDDLKAVTPKKLKENIKKLPSSSLTQKGITQLTSTLSDDEDKSATPKMVNDVDKKIKPISEGGTGATTAVNARKNLGLGTSATLDKTDNFGTSANLVATQLLVDKLQKEMNDAIPVGVIASWDHDVAPKNWLFVRDQKFSASEYPELAKLYPSLTLNDRRGTVDRALDAGRGFDSGRVLGSYQEDAMQPIRGSAGDIYGGPSPTSTGAIYGPNNTSGTIETTSGRGRSVWGFDFDSSRVTRTANETRMKNVATNKIIKAK